mgnify:FL=1|jgi:hypothetical protein
MSHIKDRLNQYKDKYSDCYKYAGVYVKVVQDMIEKLQDDLEQDEKENGWIPVKYHQISEKERAEESISNDIQYMLDCKMPDDGQKILVTNGETTWQDTCFIDSNGYYLDGGYDWIDIMAWMPLPKPYKEG